jgi:hypothetical protein
MEESKKMGMNKTGIAMSPVDSKAMIEGSEKLTICPPGNAQAIAENRVRSLRESGPIGSVPIPLSAKGAVKTGLQMIQGRNPEVLLDKLGERLAFERSGVRLYEALMSKWEASAHQDSLPPLERLRQIRDEELKQFLKLDEIIRKLGADPTAQTPSANVIGLATLGAIKVADSGRLGFVDSLQAALMAELTDNDSWALLVQLAKEAGLLEEATAFREALQEEQEHLESIRTWIENLTLSQFGVRREAA